MIVVPQIAHRRQAAAVIAHHARRNPGTTEIDRMARVFARTGDVASRKRRVASAMDKLRAIAGRLPPPKRPSAASWRVVNLSGPIEEDGSTNPNAITPKRVRRALADAGWRHVLLKIETEGGRVAAAEEIAAAIERHKPGVTVRATGWCASAGLLVLAAGQHREAEISGRFGFHDVGVDAMPAVKAKHKTANVFEAFASALRRTDDDYSSYIARRCHIPKARVDQWKRAEQTLTARTAEAAGLIHKVVQR